MKDSIPSIISELQPLGYLDLENNGRRLFILYPKTEADSLSRLLEEKTAHELYPIGTFVSGDIVCWEEREQIVVVFHDNYELSYSDVPLFSFIERLRNLDPDLEKDVYGG